MRLLVYLYFDYGNMSYKTLVPVGNLKLTKYARFYNSFYYCKQNLDGSDFLKYVMSFCACAIKRYHAFDLYKCSNFNLQFEFIYNNDVSFIINQKIYLRKNEKSLQK